MSNGENAVASGGQFGELGKRWGWLLVAPMFDAATIDRLLDQLETLLTGIVTDAERPVSQLPLLGDIERLHVLNDFNATEFETTPQLVHELVEAQAAITPDAEALTFGSASLSYSELNARANRLARQLYKAGACPGTRAAWGKVPYLRRSRYHWNASSGSSCSRIRFRSSSWSARRSPPPTISP